MCVRVRNIGAKKRRCEHVMRRREDATVDGINRRQLHQSASTQHQRHQRLQCNGCTGVVATAPPNSTVSTASTASPESTAQAVGVWVCVCGWVLSHIHIHGGNDFKGNNGVSGIRGVNGFMASTVSPIIGTHDVNGFTASAASQVHVVNGIKFTSACGCR